jgi:hypothetical protein
MRFDRRESAGYPLETAKGRKFQGCYDVDFLLQAESDEERDFYVTVADFFLQRKQQELIARGMF